MIDFNSNQNGGGTADAPAHNEAGFQSYHAEHEVSATFISRTYTANFALTGNANVALTPGFPNTTANTVRQAIGRTDAQANSWLGIQRNLLRDWIGVDARTSEQGNGVFGPGGGTPTYFLLTLSGLPAATYSWLSWHHDVENMNSTFSIELSVDGGANFLSLGSGRMTNSSEGGTPAENEVLPGTSPNVADGDPALLSSTVRFQFDANGTDDVLVRFAPIVADLTQTHHAFFGINGFVLDQVPEPSAAACALLGAAGLGLRRRRPQA